MGTYYTIQTVRAWKQFQKQGFLVGDEKRAMFPKEYDWLLSQMRKRIPSFEGEYPIWLWPERKEPLSNKNHHLKRTAWVCLTLEIPDELVLLSDFDAWHCVLNNCYYLVNDEEEELYENKQLTMSKEDSWERIFDLELSKELFKDYKESFWIQGTTGKIPLSAVKKVKYFRGKGSSL